MDTTTHNILIILVADSNKMKHKAGQIIRFTFQKNIMLNVVHLTGLTKI